MPTVQQFPPTPPPVKDPKELTTPIWQRWMAALGEAIASLIASNQSLTSTTNSLSTSVSGFSGSIASLTAADQTNQFADGASGAGCYSILPGRLAGTDYTNGASPRFLSIMLSATALGAGGILSIGGTQTAQQTLGAAGAPADLMLYGIVPAGTKYRVDLVSGATIGSWAEL